MLKPKVGQWCRVKFTDVGASDGICVERDKNGIKFLEPYQDEYPHSVEYSQVIGVGKMLQAENSGIV